MNSPEDFEAYFDPWEHIHETKNRLPHWRQEGLKYNMLTFRLEDSIPQEVAKEIEFARRRWLNRNPTPWTPSQYQEYHLRFSKPLMDWMDKGLGSCILKRPECQEIVRSVLMFFEGTRHEHVCWVIMPNHIHTLTKCGGQFPNGRNVGSWKQESTRQLNRLLNRKGKIWQDDYFDTLIRDEKHLNDCVRYIRRNPGKARVPLGDYDIYESSRAGSVGEAY